MTTRLDYSGDIRKIIYKVKDLGNLTLSGMPLREESG